MRYKVQGRILVDSQVVGGLDQLRHKKTNFVISIKKLGKVIKLRSYTVDHRPTF